MKNIIPSSEKKKLKIHITNLEKRRRKSNNRRKEEKDFLEKIQAEDSSLEIFLNERPPSFLGNSLFIPE
jgi:hypothetical protein